MTALRKWTIDFFIMGAICTASLQASRTNGEEVLSNPLSSVSQTGEIGTNARIAIDGKGFSIVPPDGWLIRRDMPRTSLFMEIQPQADLPYQRNIAVIKFNDSRLMNDLTAQEFSDYLIKNFPHASEQIAQYQLRNHAPIQMSDGREGILFYTEFLVRDVKMMQAHVLVSSQTNHYLATYTDIAEHFENPQGNTQFLAEAWNSMVSIELDSATPQPMDTAQSVVIVSLIMVFIGVVVSYVRHKRAAELYRRYGAMDEEEDTSVKKLSSNHSGSNVHPLHSKGAKKKDEIASSGERELDSPSSGHGEWNLKNGDGKISAETADDQSNDDWTGRKGA